MASQALVCSLDALAIYAFINEQIQCINHELLCLAHFRDVLSYPVN
jgi:hypothetical protein